MKTFLTLIIGLFVSTSFAQVLQVSPETGLITYERIITFDTTKAEQLFNKSKGWFVEYFRDAKEVIRGENKPEMIKGTFVASYNGQGYEKGYESDIKLRFKDRAIKIIIDNFIDAKVNSVNGQRMKIEDYSLKMDKTMRTGGMYQKTFKDIETKCQELTDNLKAFIEKKSDW